MRALFLLTIFLGFINHADAEDVPGCGNLQNAYGPFNYNSQKNKLRVVEDHHFTSSVKQLIKGKSSSIDGDLDYTLRAFPNHHRALFAISRWESMQKTKNKLYIPKYYSAECYLKRALIFSPDDPTVYILYGIFDHKRKKYGEAKKHYQIAIELNNTLAEAYYNLGLLYYDTKKYTLANEVAHKAYEFGYPLPGLRNKLVKSGHWTKK